VLQHHQRSRKVLFKIFFLSSPVGRPCSPAATFALYTCLSSLPFRRLCPSALPFPCAFALCRYGLNWRQALKACMKRELKLVYRDRFNLYSRTFQITYLAFLSATLFIKPGHDTVQEGQLFLLEIFFAALISTFAGFGKARHLSYLLCMFTSC